MSGRPPADGLAVGNLHAAFGKHVVLHDVSLEVDPGETLVLFGPSGAGKTVLLRAIAGVEASASGRIIIAGRDVSALGPEKRNVGVAFQNFALYPHMPARENIASPLRARHAGAAEIRERVERVAELLRITHVLGHAPRALSNGQKQRTALARALVGEPKVLLLDDPLRNVDAKLRYEMRMELPRLLRRAAAATIYVSQDYREAMALADRIAVLIDGRVVQQAAPETIYDSPASVAVARLFGDPPMNLLPCTATPGPEGVRVDAIGLSLRFRPNTETAGRECLLGMRPENLTVRTAPDPGAAVLEMVAATPLHERQVLLLRAADGQEVLASVAGAPPQAGASVWITPDPARALLYDAESGARIADAATIRTEVAA